MTLQLEDSVFFEVVQPDNSRDENRGIVKDLSGTLVTIEFPGMLEMQIVKVDSSEIRIKKGVYRLNRYVQESECLSAE